MIDVYHRKIFILVVRILLLGDRVKLFASKLQEVILVVQKFATFTSHNRLLTLDGQLEKFEERFLEMLSCHNFK